MQKTVRHSLLISFLLLGSFTYADLTVYSVSMMPSIFNFTTHAWNSEQINRGIRFSFTASSDNTMAIVADTAAGAAVLKTLTFYGDDSTFSTATAATEGSETVMQQFTAIAGTRYYFTVAPVVSSGFTYDVSVYIVEQCTLTVSEDPAGSGTTVPSGDVVGWTGFPFAINVTPLPVSYFSHWSISANDSITDSLSAATSVIVRSTRATATARMVHKPLRTITFATDTFNFIDDGGMPETGVLFQFIAPHPDSFYITIGPGDAQNPQIRWTCYGTDATFSTPDSSTGTGPSIYFRATTAGQRHYFRVTPSDDYIDNSFSAVADSFYTLIILPSQYGTFYPTDTLLLKNRQSQPVSVTLNDYFSFFHEWTVLSGSLSIQNPEMLSTIVIMDSSDVVLTADIDEKQVYTIDETEDTHRFSEQGNNVSGGILLSFSAPYADSFSLRLQKLSAQNSYLYYCGTDESFTSVERTIGTAASATSFTFATGAAGERHYFRINNTSVNFDTCSFTTLIAHFCSLTVVLDPEIGMDDTVFVINASVPYTIDFEDLFTLSGRYFFEEWTIIDGSVTIDDPVSLSTEVTCEDHATITAQCEERPIQSIREEWDTLMYNQITGGSRGGILFSFIADQSDDYQITIQQIGSNTFSVFYYDTVSACDILTSAYTRQAYRPIPVSVETPGTEYHLRVAPTNTYDSTARFRIRYFQQHSLILQLEAGDMLLDFDTLSLLSNQTITIDTPTVTDRFYFDHWTIVSGTATISDSTIYSPEVSIQSDVVIRAVYRYRPVIPLTFVWDTIGYEDIAGGTRGGLLFSFTPQQADTFTFLSVHADQPHIRQIFYFGTDSTFTSLVSRSSTTGSSTTPFRAGAAGERHFFKIAPYNAVDTSDSVQVRIGRYVTVITTSEDGPTSPDNAIVSEFSSVEITTSPLPPSTYFDHWEIIEGHGDIVNATEPTTSITVDTVDLVIEALFNPKTRYPITTEETAYLFGTHGGRDYSGGVLFTFTPLRTDTFSIVIAPADQTPQSRLYVYEQDASFSTPVDSTTGTSFTYLFNATDGELCYFRVAPVNNGNDRDNYDFTIRYDEVHTITFSATTGGAVTPSDPVAVTDSFSVQAAATPLSDLFIFGGWEIVSGNVAFFNGSNSTDAHIDVAPVGGDAHLQAQFTGKTIYTLTHEDESYQFSNEGAPSGGILFRYITVRSDSVALRLHMDTTFRYYRIDYYGNDDRFNTPVDSLRNLSAEMPPPYIVRTPQVNDTLYFRVTATADQYNHSFSIRADTTVQLTLSHDPAGTINPSDSLRVLKHIPTAISATPVSQQSRFSVWRTLSGSAIFVDSTDATTTVTISDDTRIHAVFIGKAVYDITYQPDTMTYAIEGAPDNSGGILLRYTAPAADSFQIAFFTAGYNRSINYYYYRTDSTFTTIRQEVTGRPETSRYGFRSALPGERHYFRVTPTLANYYGDSLVVRMLGFSSVTVQNDGRGTTTPSEDTLLLQGLPHSLTATPVSGFYRFRQWKVLQGSAEINDTLSAGTTFIVDPGDVVVSAEFMTHDVHTIPMMPEQATYIYSRSVPAGVFLALETEQADSFDLFISHRHPVIAKEVTYFGTDNHFATPLLTDTLRNTEEIGISYPAFAAHTRHYFRITPFGSFGDTVTVMWIPSRTLKTVSMTGGTITSPYLVTRRAGDTAIVSAVPSDSLYLFDHWSVTEGAAAVSDSLSAITSVTLHPSGDATVTAYFLPKPHDTLYVEDDGNGITVPFGITLVDTASDTLVRAYPDSRYVFDHWEIVSGDPDYTDQMQSSMRIRLNGTTRIQAHFVPDAETQANLTIHSVDISNHPGIEITATLRDRFGNPVLEADTLTYNCRQDSIYVPHTVSSINGIRGISAALVIDRSLSMSQNSRMDSALASVSTFIDAMDEQDRAAIVSFSTGVTVNQPCTSDKTLLTSALSSIIPIGETAIRDGAWVGIEQLTNETNTRAVIIFSDGSENASTRTLASTIELARRYNVTIYTIALGTEDFDGIASTLRPLADSSGGYFFYARNATELTALYEQIRIDIESRVVIRYLSPDTLFNGDTHTVICATELEGTIVRDTGYWSEDNRAPRITLTEGTIETINTVQPSGQALTISAYITDDDTIIPIRTLLYRRATDQSALIPVEMHAVADSAYTAIIPSDGAMKPGIEFYVSATDSRNARTTIGPFRINMDNSGPTITHTPPDHLISGEELHLMVTASDSDSVTSVIIYYRNALTTFLIDTLEYTGNDSYSISINGRTISSAWFEYYFEAQDAFNALSRNPVSSTYRITLNQQPQIIFEGRTTVNEGDSIAITVTAVDPENASVVLEMVSPLPDGVVSESITPARTVLNWRTSENDIGTYRIVFSTDDGNYTITDTLILKVNDIDYPPVIITPDDITATEGDSIAFVITGYDPDGAVIQFTSIDLPPGARFVDHGNDSVSVTWKTGSLDAGIHHLTFIATDGVTEIRDTLRISIADHSFSRPEIFASTYDTLIPTDHSISITIWATDKDKTPPTLLIDGVPSSGTITKNATGDSAVFTWYADADQITLTAVAFDKLSDEQSDTITIVVTVGLFYTTAALLDTNGNGIFDRIGFTWHEEAQLLEELPQPGEWIDSVTLASRAGVVTQLEPLSLKRVDATHASLILRETNTIQTGFTAAAISLTRLPVTTEALPSLVDSVKDFTGPVLTSAVYHPGTGSDTDDDRILTLHFSEPVTWLQVTTRPDDFLKYYRDGELDTAQLRQLPVVSHTFSDSVQLSLPEYFTFSLQSDSLSLRRTATDARSHVADAAPWRNLPHEHNRRVPITSVGVPVTVTATVLDTNGEGHIDRIVFSVPPEYHFPDELPDPVDAMRTFSMQPFSSEDVIQFRPDEWHIDTESGHLVLSIPEHSASAPLETGWNSFTIEFTDGFRSEEELPFIVTSVEDRAGPVIQTATVVPAVETGIGYDTLAVIFSEPVEWKREDPDVHSLFSFHTNETFGRGTAFADLSDDALAGFDSTHIRIIMDNGFTFRPEGDSIRIRTGKEGNTSELYDFHGTVPHPDNRKVMVAYQLHDNPIGNAYICPNPFIPGISIDPTSSKKGALIVVQLLSAATDCEGTFTIFDALGSVVLSDRKLHINERNPTWLSYRWNGKDASGGLVANGVYFVSISVKNRANGTSKQFGIKAGVKRVDN